MGHFFLPSVPVRGLFTVKPDLYHSHCYFTDQLDTMTQQKPNRYVNFQGINCDGRARRILDNIEEYTKNPPHNSSWSEYFQAKCGERLSIGQDELHFICSQMNNVYSLFEEYEDTDALNLLEQIEEECC